MSKEHGNPRSPAGSCRLKSCSFADVVRITSQGLTYDEILDRYLAPCEVTDTALMSSACSIMLGLRACPP